MSVSNNKVILGFSGGVDSSASCLILKERGYEVIGLYFDISGKDKAPESIKKTADSLDIEIITINASELFEKCVKKPFCRAYEQGRTPNPCILCNPSVKFRVLKDAADRLDASYIATGHYAGITEADGLFRVKKGANILKDQSYMLCRLGQNVLSRLILPLSDCTDKNTLRELLKSKNIPCYSAKDSQDICFIPDGDYAAFLLKEGCVNKEGNFIDKSGNVLAKHKGILNYTIGQRKGLGVAMGHPVFVTNIDCKSGNITLGTNEELQHNIVTVNQIYFTGLSYEEAKEKYDHKKLNTKLRYTVNDSAAELEFSGPDSIVLHFDKAQRAPAPGQSAVFYDNDILIGTGIII